MAQLGQKKSRKGCNRCKQRRVKCDEETPCGNCIRRNEECSLLEPSPSSSELHREPGLPVDTEEWLADLELMHHYGTNAASIGKSFQARTSIPSSRYRRVLLASDGLQDNMLEIVVALARTSLRRFAHILKHLLRLYPTISRPGYASRRSGGLDAVRPTTSAQACISYARHFGSFCATSSIFKRLSRF